MIPLSKPIVQGQDWKNQLANAVRDPGELLKLLDLPDTYLQAALQANRIFPLRVPRAYIERIEKGNPHDPLLRQVLPLEDETEFVEGYTDDPVGDLNAQKAPGLLHKYQGRILLITTPACAVHCRYCFRRNFPYNDAKPDHSQWQEVVDYLQSHDEINEVILSGGDPLSLSDSKLKILVDRLADLEQIKTLRIHTRFPIVIPQRITQSLLEVLAEKRLNVVVVVHVNHPNEIDVQVKHAMSLLRQSSITLLNQSVLLKNINDNSEVLNQLSHTLFDAGILPYYLHQLDKVNGAAHFAVAENHALEIMSALRQQLPGYLVPRLVVEQAGEPSKLPLV